MSFGPREANKYYGIDAWGHGYFGVNARGHLTVHPTRGTQRVDLFNLIPRLKRRKMRFPLLLRFPQILHSRVEELFGAFDSAIREFEYPGRYRGVFPIKVNQHASVVSQLVRAGKRFGMGLEAGSKAELAVALQHDLHDDALIVCNGYKDAEYVKLALRGLEMGRNVVLIIEKPHEVDLIRKVAKRAGVKPLLGARMRLVARSSGKWERSSGAQAKFGLTTQELIDVMEGLKRGNLLDGFCMLHFHIGSQITEIRRIKAAVREGARVYAKLRAEGCPLEYLDVGGGLGVDYDGSNTSYEASMNYTISEYANDVVYIVQEICDAENVPVPTLVSESGRALTAYHAVLISEIGGQNLQENGEELIVPADAHESVRELYEIWEGMTRKNHREFFHDAEARRDELLSHFDLGYLSLRDRAICERLMMMIGRQALHYAQDDRFRLEEFEALEKRMITKYIANFSVFQSLPDSWALDQLFPVVPIHRMNEEPTVPATLCDVTCDSFGEIDRFVDLRDVKESLKLHPLQNGEPYYVAVLLLGAYQDVLGDYHNLFGRVDEAQVFLNRNGGVRVSQVRLGDEAHDVLRLFDHDPETMIERIQSQADQRVDDGEITKAAAKRIVQEYRDALAGYTYLRF